MSSMPKNPQGPQAPMAVGAPSLPGPVPGAQGPTMIPFSEFYAATKGDKEKAEALIPGITSPEGAKMLKPGPDGRPHVEVDPQALAAIGGAKAQQTIDAVSAIEEKLASAQKKGAPAAREWITPDEFAQELGVPSWSAIPAEVMMMVMPGIDKPGGAMAYTRRTPGGTTLFLNPRSQRFQKIKSDVLRIQNALPQAGPEMSEDL